MRDFYDDVRFCGGACKTATMHSVEDDVDPDDAYQECQKCTWHTYGPNGTYQPPESTENYN